MCVVAVAIKAHPDWSLIIAGNRDERHDRPSLPAHVWTDAPDILGGRDVASGGTWLAVSRRGRFAVVTNRRGFDTGVSDRLSRGALVTGRLSAEKRTEVADPHAYNPFNLFWGDADAMSFLTNRPDVDGGQLGAGTHGLSNGARLPGWSKTGRLTAAVDHWMVQDGVDPRALFSILRDESASPADPADSDADSSPLFIRDPAYGTRCSTVVAISASGTGLLLERSFDRDGRETGLVSLSFDWPVT